MRHICSFLWAGTLLVEVWKNSDGRYQVDTAGEPQAYVSVEKHRFWIERPGLREAVLDRITCYTLVG